MNESALVAVLYYSKLAQEPDLAELVELFVAELPARLESLRQAAAVGDWEQVGRIAHQLKGAGGSHGFPQLGQPAWQLEQAARASQRALTVSAAIDELAAACARVRAGVPS